MTKRAGVPSADISGKGSGFFVKALARETISAALYYSGMVDLYRLIKGRSGKNNSVRILAYHNIGDGKYMNLSVPEIIFRQQIEFLMRHNYNIIPLEEAVNLLSSRGPIPKDTIVITFDDGYRSMFTSVFPIVKAYKIPVTIFLSVEPLDKGFPLFVDALVFAVEKTREKKLDLTEWGLKQYSLESRPSKEKALHDINMYGKTLCNRKRGSFIESVFGLLKVDIASQELKKIMLSWEEARIMADHGVTFGAHSLSHPILTKIPSLQSREEILQSKKRIEEKLGREVKFFAYPYGTRDSFNPELAKVIEENGFACACTLVRGDNKAGVNPFLLHRSCVTDTVFLRPAQFFSIGVFAMTASGLWDRYTFRRRFES